mmetsp:Transcript_23354/g.49978  ORF Transcript_23354/g.49978 Transcript_23354/m.49978 type:complete len:83 (-) Transcript_23354:764-1012(-)
MHSNQNENESGGPGQSYRAKSRHPEIRSACKGSSLFRLTMTLPHIIHPLQSNFKCRLISALAYRATIRGFITNVDLDRAVIT